MDVEEYLKGRRDTHIDKMPSGIGSLIRGGLQLSSEHLTLVRLCKFFVAS